MIGFNGLIPQAVPPNLGVLCMSKKKKNIGATSTTTKFFSLKLKLILHSPIIHRQTRMVSDTGGDGMPGLVN